MAWENKTVDDVYNILYNGLCTKFNQTFRLLPKSFIHIFCKVIAGLFTICYRSIGWWGLQQYPKTAYYGEVSCLGNSINPLVMLGNLYGAGDPKPATAWEGVISVDVENEGSYLSSGTQLKSENTGKIYLTEEAVLLSGESVSVNVKCSSSGSEGNLDEGDTLNFVNPLSNVKQVATVSSVTKDGTDAETETEYRRRVDVRFSTKPHGGSYADYRENASSVSGVLQTYIYGDCYEISGENWSSTGVIIYVAGNPDVYADRIPDSALLKAVGQACTYDPDTGLMRKMVGQVIDPKGDESYANVKPVSVRAFDVYLTGLSGVNVADFAEGAKSALITYLEGREPYIKGLSNESEVLNKVSLNNISSVLNEYAVSLKAEFEGVRVVSNATVISSYTLTFGELAKLGTFYIDGVAV